MIKKLKNTLRKEMLNLMNEDEEWYKKKDTDRYKQIQALGKRLEETSTMPFMYITKEEFDACRNRGMQFKEIANQFNVNIKTLQKWREDNGYPIYHNKGNRKKEN